MSHRSRMMILGSLFALASTPASSQAGVFYQQTNLVSNRSDVGAAHIDPNLRNPWGISSSPTSPFWVSNQVTGTATLYDGAGTPQALVVMIPPSPSGGNPTGQVFNPTADFVLPTGGKAFFLFATLNGTITGWNPGSGTTAQIAAMVPQAVYTGLALGNNNSGNFLYAANSDGATINVFNASFAPASLGGSFVDPKLPSGFTPYNIQNLNGTLYVTYEHEGVGGGVVNAFDLNGNFLRRISANAAGGPLESPWGLTLAPSTFGPFANALLVGNEGDGHISAFDPITGNFLGQLSDANGAPIANTGLWGLTFGNGGNGGDPNILYFAAGINNEADGLFGSIQAVPEPGSVVLFTLGGLTLAASRRLWRRRS